MATEKTRLLSACIIGIPLQQERSDDSKGLSLEELMPFENDPWWQNLRRTCFLSFWATLIVIFVAACAISMTEYDSCQVKERLSQQLKAEDSFVLQSTNIFTPDIIKNSIVFQSYFNQTS